MAAVAGVCLTAAAMQVQARSASPLPGIEQAPICRGFNGRIGRSPELLVLARAIARDDVQLAQNAGDIEDNLDIFEKLGLLEGHLIVGMALMDAKMTKDALPHFGHPVKELYEYLEPVLKARDVPDFKADLMALEAKAKATPPDPKLAEAYAGVLRKVEALRVTIPPAMMNSHAFVVRAIALLMKDSADDLGESIEKGRIANTVEYHDALGFARYTAAIVQARQSVLGGSAAPITTELKLVMSAFPSLKPPERPAR
ncbi:MAG: hypothetical protein AB7G10_23935, partial [Reyranellaceae bacterium]